MKMLITGAKGFVGKNLVMHLKNTENVEILEYDIDTKKSLLDSYTKDCDFVFHLAGVNRPKQEKEFMEGNFGFTSTLLTLLKKHNNKAPVLITSSVQAQNDNPYGRSKKAGEDLIFSYAKENDVKVYVYRLTNLFGKWSRPNYNTVVATFCYNVSHGIDIRVNDKNAEICLSYIDDVVIEFIKCLKGSPTIKNEFCIIPVTYKVSLGYLADTIESFKESRKNLYLPDVSDAFISKLYSTYLNFLPRDGFSYDLWMHADHRGSFTELLRTKNAGQVSVNISKPNIIKGQHYHHTKNEKFIVVSGRGVIRFRDVYSKEIIKYHVSGDKLQVIDIPTGYTHNIENLGDEDMVTIMWCSECFDPNDDDTHFLEV